MMRTVVFVGWLLFAFIAKVPSSVSFLFGILILCVSLIALITNHQGLGLRLCTYAFGIFVVGVISYGRELIQNEKK